MYHEIEDYNGSVQSLLSPLHQATSPAELRATAARRTHTLVDMHTYLHRIGLDINTSNKVPKLIFHVTGTKGKGSTLAFCESILRNGYKLNTGMFTSPHLICIRERIRINGLPISEKVFAQVYWTVRQKLEAYRDSGTDPLLKDINLSPLPKLPGYFRMLTLMAIYAFCHCESTKIDVILLEVGMGGRYDSTNVFEPYVPGRVLIRGVTLIDYDHMRVLGSTLEQIAWEKGGIFCSNKMACIGRCDGGYDAFINAYRQSAVGKQQDESSDAPTVFVSGNNTQPVLDILRFIISSDLQRGQLQIVDDLGFDAYPKIGLKGAHQRSNAVLAMIMCKYAMNKHLSLPFLNNDELHNALSKTFWPGRCHSVALPNVANILTGMTTSVNLRCDGAHTLMSINACIDWFRSVASNTETIHRVLIFNCSHERNPLPLLYCLYQSKMFDSVYFCHADFERPSMLVKRLEDEWYTRELPIGSTLDRTTLKIMCNKVGVGVCDAPSWQETLANAWRVFLSFDLHNENHSIDAEPNQNITFGIDVKTALESIQDEISSMKLEKKESSHCCVEICVTGSLYIVGSALEAAGWKENPSGVCEMANT